MEKMNKWSKSPETKPVWYRSSDSSQIVIFKSFEVSVSHLTALVKEGPAIKVLKTQVCFNVILKQFQVF